MPCSPHPRGWSPATRTGRAAHTLLWVLFGLAGRAQLVPPVVGDDRSPSPAHLAARGPRQVGAGGGAGRVVGSVSHRVVPFGGDRAESPVGFPLHVEESPPTGAHHVGAATAGMVR